VEGKTLEVKFPKFSKLLFISYPSPSYLRDHINRIVDLFFTRKRSKIYEYENIDRNEKQKNKVFRYDEENLNGLVDLPYALKDLL